MSRDNPVDPMSGVGRVSEEDAPRCEICGDAIVEDPDHYVVTWIEDGQVEHRHFCGMDCRERWDDER